MPRAAKGHIEQLPSGSFRVSVYGGIDPITRQEIRLRSTVKDQLRKIMDKLGVEHRISAVIAASKEGLI